MYAIRSYYDLICLDIMMPGMDGHKVLQKIRETERNNQVPLGNGVKIIMTTALGDKQNVLNAFRTSCDAYMVKPYDRNRLMEILRDFKMIN